MRNEPDSQPAPEQLAPRWVRVAGAWSWPLVGVGIIGWAILRVLAQMPTLVIALLVALLLTVVLQPLLRLTGRWHWPRLPAAVAVVLGFVALGGAALTLVITTVASGLHGSYRHIREGIVRISDWLAAGPLKVNPARLDAWVAQAEQWLTSHAGDLGHGVVSLGASALELAVGLLVCLLSTILLLADGGRLWRSATSWLQPRPREAIRHASQAGWHALGAYVHTQSVIALLEGIVIGITGALLGVPFAAAMGVLVFITAFIPIIGILIAGLVCVGLTLLTKTWVAAVVMLVVVVVVHELELHVLQPWLMGHAVSVHPLAVIVGVTAGSMLAGVAGALFSVPLLAFGNAALRSLAHEQPPGDVEPEPVPQTPV